MPDISCVGYFPYSSPQAEEEYFRLVDANAEEIPMLTSLRIRVSEEIAVPVTFSFVRREDLTDDEQHSLQGIIRPWDKLLLMAEASLDFQTKGVSAERAIDLSGTEFTLRTELEKTVRYLVMLTNLARPGSLSIGEGAVLVGGRLHARPDRMLNLLWEARTYARKIGWPPVRELQIADVIAWLGEDLTVLDKVGGSVLTRALAAYSYLFTTSEQFGTELLFSLIGIEALLARGTNSIQEQIGTKSQIIFGPLTAYKKKLSAMYHYRSRFVHGDLDFPSRFHPYDASPDFEKFTEELYEATDLASILLIALLQELALQGRSEFCFEYRLVE